MRLSFHWDGEEWGRWDTRLSECGLAGWFFGPASVIFEQPLEEWDADKLLTPGAALAAWVQERQHVALGAIGCLAGLLVGFTAGL